jgi:hypothetical protein
VRFHKQENVVWCKWILKRKEGVSPNEPPRFKARLLAKGFSHFADIDYNDVFSLVVKHIPFAHSLVLCLCMNLRLSSDM